MEYFQERYRTFVRQVIEALPDAKEVIVIGEGPAGLVALCAAATNPRITKAAAVLKLPSAGGGEGTTGAVGGGASLPPPQPASRLAPSSVAAATT